MIRLYSSRRTCTRAKLSRMSCLSSWSPWRTNWRKLYRNWLIRNSKGSIWKEISRSSWMKLKIGFRLLTICKRKLTSWRRRIISLGIRYISPKNMIKLMQPSQILLMDDLKMIKWKLCSSGSPKVSTNLARSESTSKLKRVVRSSWESEEDLWASMILLASIKIRR